jgi:uncharacterized protein YggT (Ycf19 family)
MIQLTRLLKSILNIILSIIGTFLGLRIILKLFGANDSAEFVNWIYETTIPLIQPFENIFRTVRIDGRFVIEFSTLFAILVYGLIGSVIFAGLDALDGPTSGKKR